MGIRHVYIDGEEVGIEANSWSVTESAGNKSRFNFVIKEIRSATIYLGAEVTFYDDTTYLWGGHIKSCPDLEEEIGVLFYQVTAEDYNEIPERIIIAKGFVDETIENMVKYIVDNFLADYGITQGTIESTTVINRVPLNYIFAHSALNHLAGFGNYVWWIDKYKALHFRLIGYEINSNTITDSYLAENLAKVRRDRTLQDYRNRQYVKGSDRLSVQQVQKTPTPTPNSSNREFFVKYKLALEPVIEVNRAGAGWVEETVGVRGLHEGSGAQWWWSYGSSQISHDEDQTVLTASDAIRVTYYGLIPLITVTQKTSEVTLRGYYDAYCYNGKLEDSIDAFKYSYNLLEKYANEADTFDFIIYEKTYNVTEQVLVQNTLRGIDEYFLIKGCTWSPRSVDQITYTYSLLDGTNLGGWEDFFKNLVEATEIELDDNEIIIVTKPIAEEITLAGQYEIYSSTPLYPSNTLYPSDTRYPNEGTISNVGSISD